jgi:protein ImuB
LERPELQSLLGRLGIRTLGKFAEIEESHIAARFGVDGVEAHRLARGMDGHHVVAQPAPIDLVMSRELEPPAERIDIAAFTGRALVVQLINELLKRSLTCERVTIEAEMENGETLSRCWRFDGVCTEKSLTERVRWQLEGWCQRKREERSAGGIATLRLIPDQLRPNIGEQRDFWNATTASDERAARGFSRLQALLGPDAVQIAAVQGGRHPTEQAIFTAGGDRVDEPKTCYPWPNSIPPPAPSVVHVESPPVELLDESGDVVQVSNRGLLSRQPARLRSTKKSERIIAWAGPWTSDEQWWDTERHKRRAFLQIVTESGTAHLVAVSGGNWQLDATYD